jgi:hypothetical protein
MPAMGVTAGTAPRASVHSITIRGSSCPIGNPLTMHSVTSSGRQAALLILLASIAMSALGKEVEVEYAELLKPVLRLDQPRFNRLQGVLRVTKNDTWHACPGASISLLVGGEKRELAIAADGRVDVPVDRALADGGAKLLLKKPDNAPPCSLSANVIAKPELRRELPYQDLAGLVAQMQAFVEAIAGGLSMFAPDVEGLVFTFADPAELTIHAAAGDTVLSSVDGRIELKMSKELAEENPLLSWNRPVVEIHPSID